MSDLAELIARVEAATGPDREIDAELWQRFTPGATRRQSTVKSSKGLWPDYTIHETRDGSGALISVPAYTSSLDAALGLCERVLPGWTVANIGQDDAKRWWAELREGFQTSYGRVAISSAMPTPALALLAALLRALSNQPGE